MFLLLPSLLPPISSLLLVSYLATAHIACNAKGTAVHVLWKPQVEVTVQCGLPGCSILEKLAQM